MGGESVNIKMGGDDGSRGKKNRRRLRRRWLDEVKRDKMERF